tara:strand:- start:3506 stop:4132 length:627 start_codon:yes stop_codon:yes gene_type:complete
MASLNEQFIRNEVRNVLRKFSVASVLIDRAKIRIKKGGDSTVKYPELWATENRVGLRQGGEALNDTGMLMGMLSVEVDDNGTDSVSWTLTDGSGYGVKHQEGFINKGPIAVALSDRARMPIKAMGDPPHDIAALDAMGFEEAPDLKSAQELSNRPKTKKDKTKKGKLLYDYYIIEDGAKVPARPIANNPPEDITAITNHIKRAIRGIK